MMVKVGLRLPLPDSPNTRRSKSATTVSLMQIDLQTTWYSPVGTSGTKNSCSPSVRAKSRASSISRTLVNTDLGRTESRITEFGVTVLDKIYFAGRVGDFRREVAGIPVKNMTLGARTGI